MAFPLTPNELFSANRILPIFTFSQWDGFFLNPNTPYFDFFRIYSFLSFCRKWKSRNAGRFLPSRPGPSGKNPRPRILPNSPLSRPPDAPDVSGWRSRSSTQFASAQEFAVLSRLEHHSVRSSPLCLARKIYTMQGLYLKFD